MTTGLQEDTKITAYSDKNNFTHDLLKRGTVNGTPFQQYIHNPEFQMNTFSCSLSEDPQLR